MKILILLFTPMCIFISHAQEEDPNNCVHDVSTNYQNSTNDALPTVSPNQYLNGFNWLPIQNQLFMDYSCTNMEFAGVPIVLMNNIMTSNLSYYNYIEDGPLLLNENGWELLLVNLGYYPDNVNEVSSNTFASMPYIVIYNRYTGIMRVFFNFGLDYTVGNGPDAVEVMVSFENDSEMSGLLRLNEGSDQGLDTKSDVQYIRSHAKAPAQGPQWASTDFQLAYDPCTCFYPSMLRIDFFQSRSSTIELVGRAITLPDEPLVNNTTLQSNPTEFLSGYDFDGLENAKGGGLVMHKSLEKMIKNYKENYEKYNQELISVGEHNARVKKNLAILEMGLFVTRIIANPPSGITTLTEDQLAEKAFDESYAEYLGLTQAEIDEKYFNLGIQNDEKGWFGVVEKFYKGIVKADSDGKKSINQKALFQAIGQVFGEKGKTFIEQNFVTKQPPKKPAIPTATFSEMTYKGEILNQLELGGPEFYTPGTYGSDGTGTPHITQVSEYPVYNEILAPFALLKSPKVKIIENNIDYSFDQDIETINYNMGSSYDVNIYKTQNWTTEYQIMLDEELLYTLNPALDIENYTISASFEFIATPKERDVQPDDATPGDVIINTFLAPYNCVNLSSDNYDLTKYIPITTNDRPYNYYNTPIYNNFDFSDEVNLPVTEHITSDPNERQQKFHLVTEHIPVDAFTPFRASIGLHHQTAAHGYNYITDYDLVNYDHTVGVNGDIEWDLSDPDLIKPKFLTLGYHGYEFDLQINLKLLVTMEFATLNSEDQPNSVTQLLTYAIEPDNMIHTQAGAINNLYYSSSNVSQFEKALFFGDQTVNVGQSYDYSFTGQAVEGCSLNGNTYTCQAWDDITILGNIEIAPSYQVNFYAGNEIYVLGESTIPPTANLEIRPVLDYSMPNPKAKYGEVYDFCNGINGNAPAYQANRAEERFSEALISDNVSDEKLESLNENWDFTLFPNPTRKSTTIRLIDIDDRSIEVECFDITMKKMNIVKNTIASDTITISTESLSPGVYIIKVLTNGGFKTKRLIIY